VVSLPPGYLADVLGARRAGECFYGFANDGALTVTGVADCSGFHQGRFVGNVDVGDIASSELRLDTARERCAARYASSIRDDPEFHTLVVELPSDTSILPVAACAVM
jgi:hypothetical protein